MDIYSALNQQSSVPFEHNSSTIGIDPLQLDDKLLGTDQDNVLQALSTGSAIYGLDGDDIAIGNAKDDILFGNNGDDFLLGEEGNDLLNGGRQKDFLHGGDGDDRLVGGGEDDLLYGGAGKDYLSGQSGEDRLVGGEGDDLLYGGVGIDTVIGGNGNDKLADYDGGDYLTAGEGADEFWVGSPTTAEATYIEDFEAGTDRIKMLRLGASFENLAIRDGEDGAVISDRGKPVAIVRGVKAEDLTAESFIFGKQELADDFQDRLQEAIGGTLVPGIQSMIVAPDGTVWNGAEGLANIETGEPFDPNSLMPTNSTSKLFVGTIVLQLMEEGKLNLDESFGEYLPEVASQIPGGDNITIRQLLTHTSGLDWGAVELVPINDLTIREQLIDDLETPEVLRDFLIKLEDEQVQYSSFEDPAFLERFSLTPESLDLLNTSVEQIARNPANYSDLEFTVQDYVKLSYNEPLLSEPGTEFSYADTNQEILSLIIEKITGTSYITQLRERILEPLGMNNTFYAPEETLPNGFPTLYSDSNNDGKTDTGLIDSVQSPYTYFNLFGYSAGGVFSTPSDMTRFAQALYRGELITPSTIERANSNGSPDFATFNYGLTSMYTDSPTRGRILGHSGGGDVSSGWTTFFPDLNASIVTMSNGGDSQKKTIQVDGKIIEEVEPRTQFLFGASKDIVKQYPNAG